MKKFIAVIMVLVCVLAGASASAAVAYESVVDIFLTVKDYQSGQLDYADYYEGDENTFTNIINSLHEDYDIYLGVINNDESANVQLIGKGADTFTHYVNYETGVENGIVNIYSIFTALADNIKEDDTPAIFFFAECYSTNTFCIFSPLWTDEDIEAFNTEHKDIPIAMNRDMAILKMNYAFAKN